MLFPISDDDREILKPMFVTYILLAINIAVFFYQVANPDFTYGWSVIPREITTGEDLVGVAIVEASDGSEEKIPQAPGPP